MDELRSDNPGRDAHYEEAACISDEMRLHQLKMMPAEKSVETEHKRPENYDSCRKHGVDIL